ncbi:hypothetical protein BKA69DRAFT_1177641 [Paraphysoderma sedebokerense]|nr:hypothetical protein BKA69DRAFT_1177641 [Paraphysoderma sedebokerense]
MPAPCKFFASGSCRYGNDCRFSHDNNSQPSYSHSRSFAPSSSSTSYRQTPEPCRFFKQGSCRYGNQCRYFHDMSTGGPTDPLLQRQTGARKLPVNSDDPDEFDDINDYFDNMHNEMLMYGLKPWEVEDYDTFEDIKAAQRKFDAEAELNKGVPSDDEFDDDDDLFGDETEQRMNNGGFTDLELQELLAQGVKPWDNDAWDVLEALKEEQKNYAG